MWQATGVTRLGEECPWTQVQEVGDVIGYTQAELLEAQQAVGAAEADELVDELGDVLFNTLLLIEVARRERPQVSLDVCAEAAVRKLRRRTPYLFGGPPATTIEEAEAAWQQAKAAERSRRGPPPAMRLSDGSTEPSLPRRRAVTAAAAAAAVALTGAPRLATPLPPPRGAAEPLVPLLQCRVLLAELAALALGGGAVDWRGAQRVLRARTPPCGGENLRRAVVFEVEGRAGHRALFETAADNLGMRMLEPTLAYVLVQPDVVFEERGWNLWLAAALTSDVFAVSARCVVRMEGSGVSMLLRPESLAPEGAPPSGPPGGAPSGAPHGSTGVAEDDDDDALAMYGF